MVKRWTITTPDVIATMKINGVPIILEGLDGRNFDTKFIRDSLRDIVPETSEQNMLCNAEATLFGTQLLSVEYYRHIPTSFLFDMIFTGELCITFIPTRSTGDIPEKIDIEEEIALSEVQLLQRLRNGETLDDIDKNCRDVGQTAELSV
jgi:hypothetical protein